MSVLLNLLIEIDDVAYGLALRQIRVPNCPRVGDSLADREMGTITVADVVWADDFCSADVWFEERLCYADQLEIHHWTCGTLEDSEVLVVERPQWIDMIDRRPRRKSVSLNRHEERI